MQKVRTLFDENAFNVLHYMYLLLRSARLSSDYWFDRDDLIDEQFISFLDLC